MSDEIGKALVESGVVRHDDMVDELAEFRRWGLPSVPDASIKTRPLTTPQQASAVLLALREAIDRTLTDRSLVLVRITDPDMLRQYVQTETRGVIRVQDGSEHIDCATPFGRSPKGAYIFPWSSQELEEAFERGDVHLVQPEEVYFSDAQVQFYGEDRTFIVCTPTQA